LIKLAPGTAVSMALLSQLPGAAAQTDCPDKSSWSAHETITYIILGMIFFLYFKACCAMNCTKKKHNSDDLDGIKSDLRQIKRMVRNLSSAGAQASAVAVPRQVSSNYFAVDPRQSSSSSSSSASSYDCHVYFNGQQLQDPRLSQHQALYSSTVPRSDSPRLLQHQALYSTGPRSDSPRLLQNQGQQEQV
jgi:hypothetical protein